MIHEDAERFFKGYEIGLSGAMISREELDDYFLSHGWSMGHIEREGWLRKKPRWEKVKHWVQDNFRMYRWKSEAWLQDSWMEVLEVTKRINPNYYSIGMAQVASVSDVSNLYDEPTVRIIWESTIDNRRFFANDIKACLKKPSELRYVIEKGLGMKICGPFDMLTTVGRISLKPVFVLKRRD